MNKFKRYCKTLQLEDSHELIEGYKKVHAMGNVWKEIEDGMKEVGILDMEIYISGTALFMIMDTTEDFDHETAMTRLGKLPKQAEWEEFVSKFQKSSPNLTAKDKWKLVERIYELNQNENYEPENGYLKKDK